MFETVVRQLRMAWSILRGVPISPGNLERLIDDARATLREFGAPGSDVERLIDGPFADPNMRRHLQDTSVRRTVKRAARVSPYYREVLTARGIDPSAVTTQSIENLPLTRKSDVLKRTADFIAEAAARRPSRHAAGPAGPAPGPESTRGPARDHIHLTCQDSTPRAASSSRFRPSSGRSPSCSTSGSGIAAPRRPRGGRRRPPRSPRPRRR